MPPPLALLVVWSSQSSPLLLALASALAETKLGLNMGVRQRFLPPLPWLEGLVGSGPQREP